jgi:uncharacterized repeat protein (TIGR01451 family)
MFLLLIFALATLSTTLAAPPPALRMTVQSLVPACAPISADTTWTTGNVYLVQDCTLVVAAGVTLTIQPGVIVKFGGIAPGYGSSLGSTALVVDGTLHAIGTAAQPIIFTSANDDSYGGDSTSNGASSGAAGDWYGLLLRAGSVTNLDQFVLRYGGSGVFNSSLGYGRAQIDLRSASATLRNGTISNGNTKGIYLEGSGITPTLEQLTISANRASNGRGYAIYQHDINMQPHYAQLSLSNNDRDEVTIGGSGGALAQDVTLGGTTFGFECGYTVCQLTVPNARTLTVAPGTIVDFRLSFGLAVASGGTLIAEGTVLQPVTFTSQLAAAGDSGHYWMGIWAKSGSTLRLDQCVISYAEDTNFGLGGLEINTNDAVVQNCLIHHNRHTGVYITSKDDPITVQFTNVSVTDNGRYGVSIYAGPAVTLNWQGGAISRNGWAGVGTQTWNNALALTLEDLTIANNGALGTNASQQAGLALDYPSISPTLRNLTLTGNTGDALRWNCNGSITAENLAASGNGVNELVSPGCSVTAGRVWDLGAAGIPTRIQGHIEIGANALLTVLPGSSLRFDQRSDGLSYGISVHDLATLTAIGTPAQPIQFTSTTGAINGWNGIEAVDRATLVLHHCEIAYAGKDSSNNFPASLSARWGLSGNVPTVDVQYCAIHHSGRKGVHFNFEHFPVTNPPIFRFNSVYANTLDGVTNWNAPPLDARSTYWGDPSGPYHATQNPGGTGNAVGDNVIFYPWLTAPPSGSSAPGALLVRTGAPTQVSPGETVDYAIQYVNGLSDTLTNSVLVLQLPLAAEYVSSSDGGIYWPERDQVFWRLGDLPSGAQDVLTVQLRFAWGLPRDYRDSSMTVFSADNYNATGLDRAAYATIEPTEVAAVGLLSKAQFDSRLSSMPALQSAYAAALTAGYRYHSAADVTDSTGITVFEVVLVKSAQRATQIISMSGGNLMTMTITPAEVVLSDEDGGMRLDLQTGAQSAWGTWAETANTFATSSCSEGACKRNCIAKLVSWTYVKKKATRVLAWTAFAFFTGGGGIPGAIWEIGTISKEVYDCDLDCRANPKSHCCTEGQVRWSGSGLWSRLSNSCYREKCNATTGMWVPDGYKTCVAYGERCVSGIGGPGCTPCEERNLNASAVQPITLAAPAPTSELCSADKPRCRDLDLRLAKDPNEISGPQGDLLPGQTLTYTISYENEGAGRAYGVYVVNPLPAALDEDTLTFVSGVGSYVAESRELFWLVGELGPKGDPDSTGVLTYTVQLRSGLPSGTVVANQATVYFASVPEETPTNTWVNLVAPLVAEPQQVRTSYGNAVPITLRGRDVSNLALSYQLVERPRGGTLSGTPPNLSYTPAEGFSGSDSFSFTVRNSSSTSRPAVVTIMVDPQGDTIAPQVIWSIPTANATGVAALTTPLFSDTSGTIYGPGILVGFSEALDPDSITAAQVELSQGGSLIAAHLSFDPASNQISIHPQRALSAGSYRVTISGVTDLAGNALAMPYSFTFSVGEGMRLYLPLTHAQH